MIVYEIRIANGSIVSRDIWWTTIKSCSVVCGCDIIQRCEITISKYCTTIFFSNTIWKAYIYKLTIVTINIYTSTSISDIIVQVTVHNCGIVTINVRWTTMICSVVNGSNIIENIVVTFNVNSTTFFGSITIGKSHAFKGTVVTRNV